MHDRLRTCQEDDASHGLQLRLYLLQLQGRRFSLKLGRWVINTGRPCTENRKPHILHPNDEPEFHVQSNMPAASLQRACNADTSSWGPSSAREARAGGNPAAEIRQGVIHL